jgi:putative photosynthetic complex assembly protein 2
VVEYAVPSLYALAVWWCATGAILYLDSLPPRTFRWSMAGATILAAAALYGLAHTRADASVAGAYCAFTCAVLVWGWIEMSFLTGFLTGPRTTACPADCRGARHFVHAIEAILHHELAIVGAGAAVIGLTWGGTNPVGAWTFLVLWVMRASAKLNLHFGVRNLGTELLPPHLQYLRSFFRRRRINPLFPVSVAAGCGVATLLVVRATAPGAAPFEVTGAMLVASLLALAIVEHLFMVLPVSLDPLWVRARRVAPSR